MINADLDRYRKARPYFYNFSKDSPFSQKDTNFQKITFSLFSFCENKIRNLQTMEEKFSISFYQEITNKEMNPSTQSLAAAQNLLPKDFFSAICHEFRTPLNSIIGFSEILKREVRNPKSVAECADYIEEIYLAAGELSDLVNDFLDVSVINSGNFSVDMSKEIAVDDVIKRAVKLNYDYALRRNISLKTEIAEELNFAVIKLDSKRLKQILTNLISNSIKYSARNREVKISAQINEEKFLEIRVSDKGFGMTEEQVELAFQKYQTIKNPNSGIVDSFGLGLPIVKQLTELMNGKIEMKSEVNVGTEVMLRFPYVSE